MKVFTRDRFLIPKNVNKRFVIGNKERDKLITHKKRFKFRNTIKGCRTHTIGSSSSALLIGATKLTNSS